jgi:4-hydroxy-tetrahydrodipicolinate reductase
MKISVIGTGKTGSKVVEMLGEKLAFAFDESNPPTVEKLKESDAVIIFVPGEAVDHILPVVIESGIPAAWGSTGYTWPDDLDEQIKQVDTKWVLATNFSLGMNIIRNAIRAISEGSAILNDPEFKIHEVHHVHKIDAPSGTALSWKGWLDKDVAVTSDREGDVNGIHELTIRTKTEKITLKHEALDRGLFAEGAIWAIEQLISEQKLTNGVFTFDELFDLITNKK